MNRTGDRTGPRQAVDLPAGRYEIRLISSDPLHMPGFQSSQTEERWMLDLFDAEGVRVVTTEATEDLPEALNQATTVVGSYDLPAIASVQTRHLGRGGINSIVPSAAVFVDSTCVVSDTAGDDTGEPGSDSPDDTAGDDSGEGADDGSGDGADEDPSDNPGGGAEGGDDGGQGQLFTGTYTAVIDEEDVWEPVGPGIEVAVPAGLVALPTAIEIDFDLAGDRAVAAPSGALIDPFSIEIDGLSGELDQVVLVRFTSEAIRDLALAEDETLEVGRFDPGTSSWVTTSRVFEPSLGQVTMILDHLSVFGWLRDKIVPVIDEAFAFLGAIAERPQCGEGDTLIGEFQVDNLALADVAGCVELFVDRRSSQTGVRVKLANRTFRTVVVEPIPGFELVETGAFDVVNKIFDDAWYISSGNTIEIESSAFFVDGLGPSALDTLGGELARLQEVVTFYNAGAAVYDFAARIIYEVIFGLLGGDIPFVNSPAKKFNRSIAFLELVKAYAECMATSANFSFNAANLFSVATQCLTDRYAALMKLAGLAVESKVERFLTGALLTKVKLFLLVTKVSAAFASIVVGLLGDAETHGALWPGRFLNVGAGLTDSLQVRAIAGFATDYRPIRYVNPPDLFSGACPEGAAASAGWCDAARTLSANSVTLELRRTDAANPEGFCSARLVIVEDRFGLYPSAALSGAGSGSGGQAGSDSSDQACSDEDDDDDDDDQGDGDSGDGPSLIGRSHGDPHQLTFDHLRYSFQAAGEFVAVRSLTDDLEIQVRHRFVGSESPGRASLISDVAVRTTTGQLILINNDATQLDGTTITDTVPLGDGGQVEPGSVALGDGTTVSIRPRGPFLDLQVGLADERAGNVEGLLGNADGDPVNDIQIKEGDVMDPRDALNRVGREQFYTQFGPSWVPAAGERLFSGPAVDYVGPTFVSLRDFSRSERDAAEATCRSNGWTPENGLSECVFDLLVSGAPESADPAGQFDLPADTVDAGNAVDLDRVLLPNPNRATTSNGESVVLEITSPVDGGVRVAGQELTVEGVAGVGETVDDAFVVYVIDVSGSTGASGVDCNNDGVIDDVDNLNPTRDTRAGTILDCEIAGLVALNRSLMAVDDSTDASVVLMAGSSGLADVGPADEAQATTGPSTDADGNGVADVEEVLASIGSGRAELFTRVRPTGGTNFGRALDVVEGVVDAERQPGQPAYVFFLSDGENFGGSGLGDSIRALADLGVVVNTYSIGTGGEGCDSGSDMLAIAEGTTGSCFDVADPSGLQAALLRGDGIRQVEVAVDGGPAVLADLDPLGRWSATVGSLVVGDYVVRASAEAVDGTEVESEILVSSRP